MREDSGANAAHAAFAASLSLALFAATALVNVGVLQALESVFRVVLAVVATVLAAILLRMTFQIMETRKRTRSLKLAPVPVTAGDRR